MTTVAAGVDGSECSLLALRWATAEAAGRNALLRVVIVQDPTADWPNDTADHVRMLEDRLRTHSDAVARAAGTVLADFPGVAAETEIVIGNAAEELLEVADRADLLVVGSRGLGRVRGVLNGSTSGQLAGHTRCPLIVVRDVPEKSTGVIVVGVDGPTGTAPLEFAFAQADRSGCAVRAVWCFANPAVFSTETALLPPDDLIPAFRTELAEILAPFRSRYPGVAVQDSVVPGRPVDILTAEAAGADLLVVGSRGRGGFASLVLGSVAISVLHEVRRPVAVVPRQAG